VRYKATLKMSYIGLKFRFGRNQVQESIGVIVDRYTEVYRCFYDSNNRKLVIEYVSGISDF